MPDPSLEAKSVHIKALPMIDVAGLLSPDKVAQQAVGKAFQDACLDTGFFYVTGHGVSSELRASVFKSTQDFFALPIDEKDTWITWTGKKQTMLNVNEDKGIWDITEDRYKKLDLPVDDSA